MGVVDRRFGAKGLTFFVVLLDLGFLVVDVKSRDDALGQNACPEAPRRATGHAPIKDELHLIGAADVEILSNDFFEEDPSGDRSIEDLREGELALEDRQVIAIAGLAVGGREGMRQTAQPLPEDGVDLVGGQQVGDLLGPSRRRRGSDAVVQRLEGNLALGELPLEPFVAVE